MGVVYFSREAVAVRSWDFVLGVLRAGLIRRLKLLGLSSGN